MSFVCLLWGIADGVAVRANFMGTHDLWYRSVIIIPIETQTFADDQFTPIPCVIMAAISIDFDDPFLSILRYDECEVAIPDVSLCLCIDMRLH